MIGIIHALTISDDITRSFIFFYIHEGLTIKCKTKDGFDTFIRLVIDIGR